MPSLLASTTQAAHPTGAVLPCSHTPTVGVFDSGVGGLSVLQALLADMPQAHFVYLADSGYAPYGERGDDFVSARAHKVTAQLLTQGIDALVVACNTATAAAVDSLRACYPDLPIIGVEPALKPALALTRTRHIGVLATRGTLASSRFQALQAALGDEVRFTLQACDGLAEEIEKEAESHNATKTIALCQEYTRAMGIFGIENGQIDTLVLGCTHYPFAQEHLRQLLGPGVALVSTGEAVARQTRRRLLEGQVGALSAPPTGTGQSIRLFSTGSTSRLRSAAARWLNLQVPVELCAF